MSSNYDDTRDRDLGRDRVTGSDADRKIDPETGDVIGEAAGGISGVLTGAALGSLGGPIGTIIGGIAGAVGGWWAGHAISDAATKATRDDDSYFRDHYESSTTRTADRSYDDVRPAYQLGQLASRNPDYANRDFDTIEPDLRRGWTDDVSAKYGSWDNVRGYVRDAYTRGRSSASSGGTGTATTATERLGDKIERGFDNVKDRIDGDPATRPGPDATDRRL